MILFDEVESMLKKLQERMVQAFRLASLIQRRFGINTSGSRQLLSQVRYWLGRCEECSPLKEDARREWLKKSEEKLDEADRLCVGQVIPLLKKVCQEQGSRILTPLGQRYLRMIINEIDTTFEKGEVDEALARALRLNTALRIEDEGLRWKNMSMLLPQEADPLRPQVTREWRSSQSHSQGGEQ